MSKKPVVLIIRDGWGINPGGRAQAVEHGDATLLAKTPFHDHLYATYPQSTLSASGLDVGLPPGQMGNSEVGHLNLGAGRVVYQDLTRINKAMSEGELATNVVLQDAFAAARSHRLHLIGLVSDGGVHSHQEHLIGLARAAKNAGVDDLLVHAVMDGRDTSPTGGADYIAYVEAGLAPSGAKIATVIGRYFAMDRDKRWERNKLAWDAIVLGRGKVATGTPAEEVRAAYLDEPRGDEFLQPIIFHHADEQRIRDGDVVLWFNFRADRARQLSTAFLDRSFDCFDREVTPLVHYVTLTEYAKSYNVPVAFPSQSLDNLLGEVVSNAGRQQLRIAETEKYPHVTYFFNGGVEKQFAGEERIIVPSPKDVPTYDFKPEMSAPEVTDRVIAALADYDLVVLNFANPDMVGHTGVVEAAITAVETIDSCVQRVVEKTLSLGGRLLLTADHGNCELMRNADGSPNTAHTTNLVHFLYVAPEPAEYTLDSGILADVAPTILHLLGIAQPAEMTGRSLLVAK
ncbi:MAG TPA: 2,3-bisphosphoglycerate-independent phosphoglycerate mutase [Chthoniobacteraceae bacterium]|jgi:2,3-bisphosphoglycerate-independent phosphoglycerate mutase|nr:2,3-bisphosphoglycerate-independent phosphoglycerate mutase [Chthoniobacteraceae bacterium]